jgi:hypothetical protein
MRGTSRAVRIVEEEAREKQRGETGRGEMGKCGRVDKGRKGKMRPRRDQRLSRPWKGSMIPLI